MKLLYMTIINETLYYNFLYINKLSLNYITYLIYIIN